MDRRGSACALRRFHSPHGGAVADMIPRPLPEFKVHIDRPDISDWIPGNTGLRGFTSFDSGQPGPHVALLAQMHGNEIAGAIVLDRLLRAGLRPARGKLSFGFANLTAFD